MTAAAGLPGRILRVAIPASLLLASTVFVSASIGAKRTAPIRLRENLWATEKRFKEAKTICMSEKGHFMGKKSTLESSRSAPFPQEKAEPDEISEPFDPALTEVFEDAKGLLMRELLKIILQQRLLEEERGKGDANGQELPSLMELLAKYI